MKRILFCIALTTALLPCLATEVSVTDVLVSQRWPWNEKVDVDFVLTGEKSDVDVYATWDALKADDTFSSTVLLGTLFAAQPGTNRFTWDPSTSVQAGKTLTGFSVTLVPIAADAHAYLVLDLEKGGVTYRAAPDGTDGRWSDEYKSKKMVFRRIPAGAYALGEPKETFVYFGLDESNAAMYAKFAGRRTVTFTHDFYVGVFRYTTAQQSWLKNGSDGGDACSARITYEALRGSTNAVAELNIDWPNTRYAVAADSVVARLRAKAGGTFMVDLCEDEQWEVAARAGTTTFWPSGGTTAETYDVLSNHVSRIASWRGNGYTTLTAVGQQEPNAWGLYDTVGAGTSEWVLDSTTYTSANTTRPGGTQTSSTNPVGGHGTGLRVYRGYGAVGNTVPFLYLLPALRRTADPSNICMGVRFCIHISPLAFKD